MLERATFISRQTAGLDGSGTFGALMRTVNQAHATAGGSGSPVTGDFEARVFRGVGGPFEAIAVPDVDIGSELSARRVLGHHPSTNPPQAES